MDGRWRVRRRLEADTGGFSFGEGRAVVAGCPTRCVQVFCLELVKSFRLSILIQKAFPSTWPPHRLHALQLRCSLCAMAQLLSDDEWRYISDFSESATLRDICRSTRKALQGRHVSCQADISNVPAVMARLKSAPAMCTLVLKCSDAGPTGSHHLSVLKDSPSLTALTLDLEGSEIKDTGAQVLTALKDAPFLTTITLRLWGNGIGHSGAQALVTLWTAPSLTTLHLHLPFNPLGEAGAQALAALKNASTLTALTLNLQSNGSLPLIALSKMQPMDARVVLEGDEHRRSMANMLSKAPFSRPGLNAGLWHNNALL